jgi:hypothetical protein
MAEQAMLFGGPHCRKKRSAVTTSGIISSHAVTYGNLAAYSLVEAASIDRNRGKSDPPTGFYKE